tara:strand:- start:404 stop:757 length:354 start_codon:yes stop_codon:yes gene_type:complete
MEAVFSTLTDEQRVNTLNSVYQKGLSTPKDTLAFSSDKLVYLKPFISKLQNDNGITEDLSSRIMARQVIDELLQDIVEEIEVSASSKTAANKIVFEYGLGIFINNPEEDIYYSSKVA